MIYPDYNPEAAAERQRAHQALKDYRDTDATISVGKIPLTQIRQLLDACQDGEHFDPSQRFDYGWLRLEDFLATIAAARNGDATPKEANIRRDATRSTFGRIAKDTQLPAGLRARAGVAAAAVPMYEQAYTLQGTKLRKFDSHYRYFRAMQDAAKLLLTDFGEDDVVYMNALTTQILLAECGFEKAWFLPASPRQPWEVTGVSNDPNFASLGIAIGDVPRDDVFVISPSLLGHGEWPEATGPAFDMLEAYTHFVPGYYTAPRLASRSQWKRMEELRNALDPVATRIFDQLKTRFSPTTTPFGIAGSHTGKTDQVQTDSAEYLPITSPSPEAHWYTLQSSTEDVALVGATLTVHMRNLELQQEQKGLHAIDTHSLAWMQRDYAQMLWERDNPNIAEVAQHLDTAIANFVTASQAFQAANRFGDACAALFDMEGALVYKALITGHPKNIQKAVATYNRNIAHMYRGIRDSEKVVQNDPEQTAKLQAIAERGAVALLLTAAADQDIDHHLAVPAPPRTGGGRGAIDMIVFTADIHNERGYTPTAPVHIRLANGNITSFERRFAVIGRELLHQGRPMDVLKRLSTSATGKKGRPETLEALSADMAMLIVDADEA